MTMFDWCLACGCVPAGVNFTSIRPVYIYGPLNYNPVEEYFFHRLKAGRPIVVPGSGMQVGNCWEL